MKLYPWLVGAFLAAACAHFADAQVAPGSAEAQVAAARSAALRPAQVRAAEAAKKAEALLALARHATAEIDTLREQLTNVNCPADTLRAHSTSVAKALAGVAELADTAVTRATDAAGESESSSSRSTSNAFVVDAVVRLRRISDGLKGVHRVSALLAAANDNAVRVLADSVRFFSESTVNSMSELAGLVASVSIEASQPGLPVTAGSDNDVLEALRVRIVAGSIFSNGQARVVKSADGKTASVQSSQFAQAAVYLAFEAQPRVFGWTCWLKCNTTSTRGRKSLSAQEQRGYDRFYLDPSVAIRLTTIPVTGAVSGATTTEDVQSKKAAQVVIGAIGAFNFGGFEVNKARFHWGVGPLLRGLYQSVSDGQRSTRVWNLEDDLYGSWTAGVRLTLFEKDRKAGDLAQHGWAPAAYIDYSRGHFQNFETAVAVDTLPTSPANVCLRDPAACLATGVPPHDAFRRIRRNRDYVEARVFLQYVYLGLDLNNGPGPDDLRFIGGVSMRLDQFFSRR